MIRPEPDPWKLFDEWIGEILAAGGSNPDAMILATADKQGRPSARVVLYKGRKDGGIVFYTNYRSRKGQELEENPRAAVVFYWEPLGRQVRLEGKVRKCPPAESDHYWKTRPRGSQLGAWASEQSQPIAEYGVLKQRTEEFEKKFAGSDIPRPDHWGGYFVEVERFEFWMAKSDRLHERIAYEKLKSGWKKQYLAP